MSQMNVWNPTRTLIGALVEKRAETLGRPVKQNELVDEAVRAYAENKMGLTAEEIEALAKGAIAARGKRT